MIYNLHGGSPLSTLPALFYQSQMGCYDSLVEHEDWHITSNVHHINLEQLRKRSALYNTYIVAAMIVPAPNTIKSMELTPYPMIGIS